ncbi:MAG: response regulator transcription factor [Rhizomicrobium sp.]
MSNLRELKLPTSGEREATILVVEDDVLIRMAISDYLQECGFKVLAASTAAEAITIMQGTEFPLDVVFADVRMPGTMDGFGLAQWVREHRPGLPVLLASGDAGVARAAHGLCEKHQVLTKPYDFQIALARVRALIDQAEEA